MQVSVHLTWGTWADHERLLACICLLQFSHLLCIKLALTLFKMNSARETNNSLSTNFFAESSSGSIGTVHVSKPSDTSATPTLSVPSLVTLTASLDVPTGSISGLGFRVSHRIRLPTFLTLYFWPQWSTLWSLPWWVTRLLFLHQLKQGRALLWTTCHCLQVLGVFSLSCLIVGHIQLPFLPLGLVPSALQGRPISVVPYFVPTFSLPQLANWNSCHHG